MKLRIIEVEGSPQELSDFPELQEFLANRQSEEGSSSTMPTDEEEVDERTRLPKQLRDFVAARSGGKGRGQIVQRYLADLLAWGSTEWEIGTSQTSGDGYGNYIRMYKTGPRYFGAFAYVTPGTAKVNFRLFAKDAEGFEHATIRKVKEGTGYEVVVQLNSDEAYDEALRLAKLALDGVSG